MNTTKARHTSNRYFDINAYSTEFQPIQPISNIELPSPLPPKLSDDEVMDKIAIHIDAEYAPPDLTHTVEKLIKRGFVLLTWPDETRVAVWMPTGDVIESTCIRAYKMARDLLERHAAVLTATLRK